MKPAGASPDPLSACSHSSVVTMLPRYTTNMTGFFHWACGASFLNASASTDVQRTGVAAAIGEALWEMDEDSIWDILKRSEEHTSELQSLMRISYAVFCLKKKTHI